MNTNFAQRAKDIVAKHGKDKKAALAELDQLRREQFNYQQQFANGGPVNIDKELEKGTTVEEEHKKTYDFIADTVNQTGQMPAPEQVYKSIALDHIGDYKNMPVNRASSYYKKLIEGSGNKGITDEADTYANGGSIHPLDVPDQELETLRLLSNGGFMNSYASGGSIHIKKENIGKFTATKERTGKTTEELTHSTNPLTRKRAIFAQNAKKWKHEDGGELDNTYGDGGNAKPGILINTVGTTNQNYIDSLSNVARSNQYDMTQQFKLAHPNVPVDDILKGFDADKNFRNTNLDQKADSLTNIYGDLSIPTTDAYQKTAREYSNLTNMQGGMDFNRVGTKEDGTTTPAFGWRAMGMKYPHQQGATAYPTPTIHAVGGPMNGGNMYADGDFLNKKSVNPDTFTSKLQDITNPQTYAPTLLSKDANGNLIDVPIGANGVPQSASQFKPWSGVYGQGVRVPQDSINSYVGKYFKTPEDQKRMLDIISRESAGTNAFRDKSKNPGGGNDWGLSQINDKYHPNYFTGNYDMTNPEQNIKAASEIAYGSKNGWDAWNASSKYDGTGTSRTATPIKPYSHPIGVAPDLMKSSADRYKQVIPGLQPMGNTPEQQPVNAPKFNYNDIMRYAPIGMNLISALTAKKGRGLNDVNLPTISPTLISPEQLSTAPVEGAVGSQYRSSVDALSGATGGSGAAVRSGLNSLSLAGSRGAGEVYNDIYSKNAMLRGDATKYNANATDQANRTNLEQANRQVQLNREGQVANQQDTAARDAYRMQSLNAAATGLGKISNEKVNENLAKGIYGIDPRTGKKINPDEQAKIDKAIKDKKFAKDQLNSSWNRYKKSITTKNPQSTLND